MEERRHHERIRGLIKVHAQRADQASGEFARRWNEKTHSKREAAAEVKDLRNEPYRTRAALAEAQEKVEACCAKNRRILGVMSRRINDEEVMNRLRSHIDFVDIRSSLDKIICIKATQMEVPNGQLSRVRRRYDEKNARAG